MGGGRGWVGAASPLLRLLLSILLFLLLQGAAQISATPTPTPMSTSATRVAHDEAVGATRTPTAAAKEGAPPLSSGLDVEYTLRLLPPPVSREGGAADPRLASHLTLEAQLLPWAVGTSMGGSDGGVRAGIGGCIDVGAAMRAAHLALQRQPPPAGVALVVVPPPPDFTCHERHGVEYLLTKMTSPTTQALIGGIDPGLCRVASHLADKYGKLFLPWSCLEVPPRVQLKATAAHDSREGVSGGRKAGEEPWAEGSHVAMVTPTALQMAKAAVGVLSHFKWRHVVLITV
ncbi:uncharacterized protein LOC122248886, partial [Penaeus japonicus]|uniref:uncharacterized protein LOC122248886 n=1 Tax=Penaeus japonicus TaxID=27405 RepID=UPI001C710742